MINKKKSGKDKIHSVKGLEAPIDASSIPHSIESFESIFVEYMNQFNFEQVDMVNPDEKIDYTAYLVNLEKTLSNYLGQNIDINDRAGGATAARNLPRVA